MNKDYEAEKDVLGDFFKSFDDAFYECVDTGSETMLTISMNGRMVEVRICEAGKASKEFTEMLMKATQDNPQVVHKGKGHHQ